MLPACDFGWLHRTAVSESSVVTACSSIEVFCWRGWMSREDTEAMASASFSDTSVFQHGVKFHFEMVCGHVSDTFEAQAACSGCNPGLHDAVVARIHHEPDKLPLPTGTEVDPVELGKFRRNLTHGRRVVQSAWLAKKSAEVVLQLHAPAALALQSYMVCNPASLMIYGYMTGVYTGQHTASNESFGHGIIVVVNVYRAVAVRVCSSASKQPIGCGAGCRQYKSARIRSCF